MSCTVTRHQLLHSGEQLVAILTFVHVNEVDDNDAAHIPQPQLTGNFIGGSQVHLISTLILSQLRFVAVTAVHIDYMQGLGMLNDEIGTVFERNSFSKERFNLFSDAEIV